MDSSNLLVVGADGKGWNVAAGTQLSQIVGFAIKHAPGYPACYSRLRDLWKTSSTCGLDQDSINTRIGGLNDSQNLLTLGDGIVIGKHSLHLHAEASGSFLSSRSLLALVVVIIRDERHNKAKFFHGNYLESR